MKAMILSAGLGTRLLPLTKNKPKPLFPLASRPLIDILIRKLQDSDCEAVIINTHHLPDMIDSFVKGQDYNIPVDTAYEPTLLNTGGGIKNVAEFWDDRPFLVINGDIFTDIDFREAYRFHRTHNQPVTMVLHDYEEFNNVWVDSNNHVIGFGHTLPCPPGHFFPEHETDRPAESVDCRLLAYTGIQVMDPLVLGYIPEGTKCSIINVYCEMIHNGIPPKGFMAQNHYWHDIGTMEGYHQAAKEALAREALKKAYPRLDQQPLTLSKLKGDGSDRTWYRVASGESSVVMVDHGPPPNDIRSEADSFFAIGQHLHNKGIPVPRIYGYDRQWGLVALEDLGDTHFQTIISQTQDVDKVLAHYESVIGILVSMAVDGAKDFDPALAYQTAYYDRDLILEREAEYFVSAFVKGFRGIEIDFHNLKEEFERLAQRALNAEHIGFLHRDFQSRNILVRNNKYYLIDFQGGRLGPLQYDLASLLIDPYVELPHDLQETLLTYYVERLSSFVPVDPDRFVEAYRYCAINRNLQILGAFGFLSKVKGKKEFETYIPAAIRSLKRNLQNIEPQACRRLRGVVDEL
jgi:aminoglycoside/choline kinase family phosphotransferase